MSHPEPAFGWADEAAMRAFADARGFAHILVVRDGRPFVVHAPVVTSAAGLRFHVARRNRAAPIEDGVRAIASIGGADAYVSPDWYGTPDQVPTWNYVAVEAEGAVRVLARDELVDQLDRLSALHEARLAPKRAWTRDKMSLGRFEAMLAALAGYELCVEAWRGTRKLGQHKRPAERAGAVAGMAERVPAMAALMAEAR